MFNFYKSMDNLNEITPFGGKKMRKQWHNEQWYFSIIDIIENLTDSPKPTAYWNKVQKSIKTESELYPFWIKLKFLAPDGKMRPTDCTNTEGVLRIIMSVPSPKAEPLRLWLAEQGARTIEETENPELAVERAKELYKAKGYSEEWIATRLKSIEVRNQLTDEWKKRGVGESKNYSFLTAIISKGTFGLTPAEHKNLKGLEKPSQNLRDHMTNLELIFSMLGEESTRMIAEKDDAQGFTENYEAAFEAGKITGNHREQLEQRMGKKVVSSDNFLHLKEGKKEELPPEE
jgi:DNA-damage-inducible protein D